MNMIDPSDGLNRVVNLTIQDIGAEVVREQMMADADAILFCYDITNEESFFALSALFQMKMQMEYESVNNEADDSMTDSMATLTQFQEKGGPNGAKGAS